MPHPYHPTTANTTAPKQPQQPTTTSSKRPYKFRKPPTDSKRAIKLRKKALATARCRARKASSLDAVKSSVNALLSRLGRPAVDFAPKKTGHSPLKGTRRPNYEPPPEMRKAMTDAELSEWKEMEKRKRKKRNAQEKRAREAYMECSLRKFLASLEREVHAMENGLEPVQISELRVEFEARVPVEEKDVAKQEAVEYAARKRKLAEEMVPAGPSKERKLDPAKDTNAESVPEASVEKRELANEIAAARLATETKLEPANDAKAETIPNATASASMSRSSCQTPKKVDAATHVPFSGVEAKPPQVPEAVTNGSYKCPKCGLSFAKFTSLQMHYSLKHNEETNDNSSQNAVQSPPPSPSSSKTAPKATLEELDAPPPPPSCAVETGVARAPKVTVANGHKCPICLLNFATPGRLQIHRRLKHEKYLCPECMGAYSKCGFSKHWSACHEGNIDWGLVKVVVDRVGMVATSPKMEKQVQSSRDTNTVPAPMSPSSSKNMPNSCVSTSLTPSSPGTSKEELDAAFSGAEVGGQVPKVCAPNPLQTHNCPKCATNSANSKINCSQKHGGELNADSIDDIEPRKCLGAFSKIEQLSNHCSAIHKGFTGWKSAKVVDKEADEVVHKKSESMEKHTCPRCNYIFFTRAGLKVHFRKMHGFRLGAEFFEHVGADSELSKKYHCTEGKESSLIRRDLQIHCPRTKDAEREAPPPERYQCPKCPAQFTKNGLPRHYSVSHGGFIDGSSVKLVEVVDEFEKEKKSLEKKVTAYLEGLFVEHPRNKRKMNRGSDTSTASTKRALNPVKSTDTTAICAMPASSVSYPAPDSASVHVSSVSLSSPRTSEEVDAALQIMAMMKTDQTEKEEDLGKKAESAVRGLLALGSKPKIVT